MTSQRKRYIVQDSDEEDTLKPNEKIKKINNELKIDYILQQRGIVSKKSELVILDIETEDEDEESIESDNGLLLVDNILEIYNILKKIL